MSKYNLDRRKWGTERMSESLEIMRRKGRTRQIASGAEAEGFCQECLKIKLERSEVINTRLRSGFYQQELKHHQRCFRKESKDSGI